MANFELDRAALDRYITGNYGEDQFQGEELCTACEDMFTDENPEVEFYTSETRKYTVWLHRDCGTQRGLVEA